MANNQMVNFNSQDVANMYRRNQLAQALQERMNAPAPVHTFQGFQAPISPLTGLTKALDMYTAKKYDDQQEEKYQAEKAAAEQKAQNIIDLRNEQATEFGNKFNPVVTEKMIGGNTSFTPTQYADAINAYGKPQEPTQASDMLNGEPTTYGRNEGTLQTTSTPRTLGEIIALESQGYSSNNPQMNKMAEYSFESRKEAERAKALEEQAKLNLQEKRDNRTENIQIRREIATLNDTTRKENNLANRELREQIAATNKKKPPPLNKGERYNEETDTVEQIPGSQVYLKNKGLHAADLSSAQLTSSIDDNLGSNITKLLASPGFNSIYGIVGGRTLDVSPDAKSAATLRKQVVDALGPAGMLINKGAVGSIGTMALGEWDKVASYITAIKDTDNPEDVRKAFENALTIIQRTKKIATDKYENEWGGSQYDTGKTNFKMTPTPPIPDNNNTPANIKSIFNKYPPKEK